MGVCLDTCHAFAAGYDVRGAPSQVLNALDRAVGLERVPVVHLNDSLGGLGSRIDHHAHLRQGQIGEGLKGVLLDPRLRGRVFILETPRSPEEDAWNLRVLRGWLEETAPQQ